MLVSLRVAAKTKKFDSLPQLPFHSFADFRTLVVGTCQCVPSRSNSQILGLFEHVGLLQNLLSAFTIHQWKAVDCRRF